MLHYKLLKLFGVGIAILTLATVWTGRFIFLEKPTPVYKIAQHVWRSSLSIHYNRKDFQETTTYVYIQDGKQTNRSDENSQKCTLIWNTEKLNVTLYEEDRLHVISEPHENTEGNYVPPLIYSNPEIMLDRNAYLLPDLIWGPNNQLVGFLESVFVAIKLNRTLVLPSFSKHNTDKQFKRGSRNRIFPLHRIDVTTLCKYISCISLAGFHRYCNRQIDGIMNIRFLKEKDFRKIEADTKMSIRHRRDHSPGETILIPINGTSPEKPKLVFTENEIRALFQSKAKCVVHPFPFFDLVGVDKNGNRNPLYSMMGIQAFRDPNGAPSDTRLLADIFRHVPRPAYIRQIASQFVRFMTADESFLSAHWRYNEGDYLSSWHCGSKEVNKKRCEKARNYTSRDFAERVIQKVEVLSKRKFTVSSVYIASPRTELKFIRNTSMWLLDMKANLKAYNSNDLEEFIKKTHPDCDFLWPHFEDILSSIEMEVCSRSISFLGSLGTTWSGNVFKSRMILDKERHEVSSDYIFRV